MGACRLQALHNVPRQRQTAGRVHYLAMCSRGIGGNAVSSHTRMLHKRSFVEVLHSCGGNRRARQRPSAVYLSSSTHFDISSGTHRVIEQRYMLWPTGQWTLEGRQPSRLCHLDTPELAGFFWEHGIIRTKVVGLGPACPMASKGRANGLKREDEELEAPS